VRIEFIPVPEPATIVLFGICLLMGSVPRMRRRRQ
jgi:hypothetical protein